MTEKKVVMVAVNDITPDPDQPRKTFNPEDVESLASTIQSQGVINPIEIDEDNIIVTGQIRWMAAKQAGLKEVPCIVWENGSDKRFERQVVENLNHHALTNIEQENAIGKLWETGLYDIHGQLGKAVGLSKQRIQEIVEVYNFRKRAQVPESGISTFSITETVGLDDHTRVQILEGVKTGKIRAVDIFNIKKIARVSDTLLDKTLEGGISLERATETADAIRDIEEETSLTDAQKDRYVKRIEEDEGTLRNYKDDIRARIKQTMTTKPGERPTTSEPIGRESPVNKFIAVRGEVGNFRAYLGFCDMAERAWAKRVLIEIRDEVNDLIEMIKDE